MKIAIGYPPLESPKGTPLLSQNRQFQWFSNKLTAYAIYPVVMASAATLLKSKGYDVVWLDGVAEKWTQEQFLEKLKKEKPDLIVFEVKTPVIKKYWQLINQLKKLQTPGFKPQTVLLGDHVTALPQESMENSKVDFILTGGDYDFALLNLVDYLTKGVKLSPGVWYRTSSLKHQTSNLKPQASSVVNTGHFQLNHNLDSLPLIDRDLTRWQLYSRKNSNFYRAPGAYTMFGRDCWWGRCTFCVSKETQIYTKEGLLPIDKIVDNKKHVEVLTHMGRYRKVVGWHKRQVDEEIVDITPLYFPFNLKLTQNHKIYCLPKADINRCLQKNGGAYHCKPERISRFLNCKDCDRKPFCDYNLKEMEAGELRTGDFMVFPINREILDIKYLDLKKILAENFTVFETKKKISDKLIGQIIFLHKEGNSQRTISKKLRLDRETVNRYICLEKDNSLDESKNLYAYNNEKFSFKDGKNKVYPTIPMDKEFLFLLGLYLAEGHITYLKNRPNSAVVGWTFSTKEKKLISQTKLFFNNYFGVPLNQAYNTKNHTEQLYVGSTIIAKVFKSLFGENCYNKHIPFEFLQLPLEKQRFLLDGLFKGDGHLRKRENKKAGAEYILETTSKQLATQVFLILLRFNAIPSFKVILPKKQKESIKYKITLFHQDIIKVFPDIKFSIGKVTYKRGFVLGNNVLVPVKKVKKEKFNDYVYNLTVKEDHSYVANFITVKNCSWTTLFPGKNFRSCSPQKALDEVGHLIEKYQVREIMDDSGTFPVGDWLREFCQGMIKRGYNKKIRFNCNMRFNAGLDEKDYQLMGKAGFRFILYGLESANQKTLDRINKNSRVEMIEPVLTWAVKAGLMPHITVMVGYPWEDKEDVQKTLNLARELFKKGLVFTMQATVVIPYPGTPLFSQCKKNHWLKTEDWDRYDMREPIMKTKLKDEELMACARSLYASFASPQFIWRTLSSVRNFDDIKYISFQGLKFLSKLADFGKK